MQQNNNHSMQSLGAPPLAIFVFSGKRKSGKDYITNLIQNKHGKNTCSIFRLSEPLKRQYALNHGLDLEQLLDSSNYKEKYRADMIAWGEQKRTENPNFFCDLATENGSKIPIWLISDARRKTDIEYFVRNFRDIVTLVRVEASEEVRVSRGWVFTPGIDDAQSECGLDKGVTWDVVINNSTDEGLQRGVNLLMKQINQVLKNHAQTY